MAKVYNLTVGDRYRALALLNAFKGNIETLSALIEDAKVLRITDEEWEKANLVKTPAPTKESPEAETWTWNDEGSEKDVELQKETVKYLFDTLKAKSDKEELGVADAPLIQLYNKLK